MTFTIPTVAEILAFFKWLLLAGFGQMKSVYDQSHKWFYVGVIAFVVLVTLGYVSVPKVPAKDADLEKKVAVLSKQIVDLSSDINGLSIKIDTLKDMGGVVKRAKK